MARVVWSSTHSMCCFVLAHYACCVKTACGECCPHSSSSTDPVLKQPVAKTTHIMCHKQHTGVLNLHPVRCIGVLRILPSLCKNNTWDEIQTLFQHMLQQTTHDGDTRGLFQHGYFCSALYTPSICAVQRCAFWWHTHTTGVHARLGRS